MIDFSASIAPFGMPAKVKEAVMASIDAAECYPDPDCLLLREALASRYHGRVEQYIFGNGAADLIYKTAEALRDRIRTALIIEPAFSEYERALRLSGIAVRHYETHKTGFTPTEELLRALTGGEYADVGLILLANPANPAGTIVSVSFLQELFHICRERGILLMVDECFIGFLTDAASFSMAETAVKDGEGLLVLNAFTKLYAMPGLRLGYLSGDTGLLQRIDEIGQPWAVSTPAQAAGLAALALSEESYRLPLIRYIGKERERMRCALTEAGCRVTEGKANYLFFYAGPGGLYEKCRERGLLLRDCSDFYGLSQGYYRAAVLKEEENDRLISVIREN
ncbi:MAG: aminotransferase class I/II-fold pyridoxal phosphate-dependent enzyme [Lachnospiraceae bacterium]|nr:aminotransferase class I/II-fold pyridoxal phosphate-dependent enzyme [Lachnospiraceae bacterium]